MGHVCAFADLLTHHAQERQQDDARCMLVIRAQWMMDCSTEDIQLKEKLGPGQVVKLWLVVEA